MFTTLCNIKMEAFFSESSSQVWSTVLERKSSLQWGMENVLIAPTGRSFYPVAPPTARQRIFPFYGNFDVYIQSIVLVRLPTDNIQTGAKKIGSIILNIRLFLASN